MKNVGIVVIGRNEGDRLKNSLTVLRSFDLPTVYVDSGSDDTSVNTARELVENVIVLDEAFAFTAARARNEGAFALINEYPELEYIQFIDGDSVIEKSWLAHSKEFLSKNPNVAVYCGQTLEQNPEASIYNRLCHIEWKKQEGLVDTCGGNCMISVVPFVDVSGFDAELEAGEVDEMCLRLRSKGLEVMCSSIVMATHDANLLDIQSFVNKVKRSAYAYTKNYFLYRGQEKHFSVRPLLQILLLGFLLPFLTLAFVIVSPALILGVIAIYLMQFARVVYMAANSKELALDDALLFAMYSMLSKPVELVGVWDALREENLDLTVSKSLGKLSDKIETVVDETELGDGDKPVDSFEKREELASKRDATKAL